MAVDERISVIVPVYNVAPYLPQSVESILSQDYQALEVILIDDGSTDGSGAICDRFAAKDSRVRVIHQKNGGAAAAKNAGLRIASGTYLSFVDSDDYLEPNVYGYMVEKLCASGADAVQFGFRDIYVGRTEEHHPGCTSMDAKTYLTRFPKDWTCALLWNKLYRRAIYEGVFFEEGHKIDDEYFTYQGFLGEGRVVTDDRIIYNYRKRASGVMSSPEAAERRILDHLDVIVKRRELVKGIYPDLRRLLDENYLDALWYLSANPGSTEKTVATMKSHLRRYFLTPGNSIPPRWLWGRLLKTCFTSTEKLLAEAAKSEEEVSIEDYFA